MLGTLSDHYLVDGWLVDGDIVELRHRTRDLISGAERPTTVSRALELVSSLGIHPDVAKEWLENVPQLRILGANGPAAQPAAGARPASPETGPWFNGVPSAPPENGRGPNGAPRPAGERPGRQRRASRSAGERPGRRRRSSRPAGGGAARPFVPENPAGDAGAGADPFKSPLRPLKDVALTRRCFRQPDGRWWLRIDVTAEHIEGSECPLPGGFAAYLGIGPGDSRTVSSAAGELTLNWQDRPVLESLGPLLRDAGAKEGSHLFLTLSEGGVLRARHLPAAGPGWSRSCGRCAWWATPLRTRTPSTPRG
nr:hypothetical protein GCM10020093_060390 [Planobispora longispora]